VTRRVVAWVAAVVLVAEAVGVVGVNGVLATVVDNQQMSLAGLDSGAMSAGTWAMGGVLGLCLALCAVILLRTALKDRPPGRFGRNLLITCAVVHAVLGALTVGLVGWAAFAFMMVVLGLMVFVLTADGNRPPREPTTGPADPGSTAPTKGAAPA
jgi:hypothetical protein